MAKRRKSKPADETPQAAAIEESQPDQAEVTGEEPDLLDKLVDFTKKAAYLDSVTTEFFRTFERRPWFDRTDGNVDEAEAAARDAARQKLQNHADQVKRLDKALAEFNGLYDPLTLVERAVGIALPTLWVDRESYATAHEAAAAWAKIARDVWNHADAGYVAQIAPSRLNAHGNTAAASIAYDCCMTLWRYGRRFKKQWPGSFAGRIRQEHLAASDLWAHEEAVRLCDAEESSPETNGQPESKDGAAKAQADPADSADSTVRAHLPALFLTGVPKSPDLVDLMARLDAAKGSGKSNNEIAREFTGETMGNFPKAKRLLTRIRKYNGKKGHPS